MMRPKRPAPPVSTDRHAGEDGSNPPSPTTPEDHSTDAAAAPNSPVPPSSKTAAVAAVLSRNPKRPKSSPSPSDAAAVSGSATSRRSRRKRKPRDDFQPQQKASQQKKVWAEHDEEELLKAAVAFRSRTGAPPRQATITEFYDAVKGSISSYITLEQVGYKLKRLKSKYINLVSAGLGSSATAHDRLVNKLSAEIWTVETKPVVEEDADADVQVITAGQVDAAQAEEGEDEEDEEGGEEEEEEEDDGGAWEEEEEEYPFIKDAAEKYWNGLGGNYGAFVSNGLKQINPVKAKSLEGKLRKQCEEETLLLVKRLDLLKEMSQLLVTASRTTKL